MAMNSSLKVPNQGLTERTNFFREPVEYGQSLIWDFYANGQCTGVVRVLKVKRKSFVIDGNRKVMKCDGKVVGFETAIVRRDDATAKKKLRQAQEKRLEFFSYENLPSSILRQLNEILDNYEVRKELLRKKYMLSVEEAKENPNRFKGGGKGGKDGNKRESTKKARTDGSSVPNPRKSVLEDTPTPRVVKSTWGRKGYAHREFDPEPDTEDDNNDDD